MKGGHAAPQEMPPHLSSPEMLHGITPSESVHPSHGLRVLVVVMNLTFDASGEAEGTEVVSAGSVVVVEGTTGVP